MSNKEIAMNIINQIPEYKLTYVINMLEGIRGLITEEVEPDDLDLKMIKEAEDSNDGSFITLDDLAKDLGLDV